MPAEANRVDTCLGDVFQLLSLFFLRIGRNRDAPAAYCQLALMKVRSALLECCRLPRDGRGAQQFLDTISDGGAYTQADLSPIGNRLAELKSIIERGAAADDPPALTRLLLRKYDYCSASSS
jgi:hypothetical protein